MQRTKLKSSSNEGSQNPKKGHPSLQINWETVDKLLIADANGTEIASYLGMHEDTLYIRCQKEKGMVFSAYKQLKRAKGDAMLKARAFDRSMTGDSDTPWIYLTKQRLGWSDKIEQKNTHETGPGGIVINLGGKEIKF